METNKLVEQRSSTIIKLFKELLHGEKKDWDKKLLLLELLDDEFYRDDVTFEDLCLILEKSAQGIIFAKPKTKEQIFNDIYLNRARLQDKGIDPISLKEVKFWRMHSLLDICNAYEVNMGEFLTWAKENKPTKEFPD